MNTQGTRLWKWTKRVFIGLAGLVVVLLLSGMIYQFVATKIDEYRYPARRDGRRGRLQLTSVLHGRSRRSTDRRDGYRSRRQPVGLADGSAGGGGIRARVHLRPRWRRLE